MLSGVTMVIREEIHLSNTPKQMHIKMQLGYALETTYAHLPMMLDDECFSVQWLFEEGFIPDAIINYLLLLGNSSFSKEIFTLPESLKDFDLKKLSLSPARFDIDKLRFINAEHLKRMDDKKLSSLFGFADEKIGQLAKVYLQEHATTKELQEKILPIFAPKDFSGEWGTQMKIIETLIQDAPMFYAFDDFKSYIIEASGLEEEVFSKALRLLLTGADNGPKLTEVYPLINAYLLEVAS
jgi:glutamyl-tRNA synthetase